MKKNNKVTLVHIELDLDTGEIDGTVYDNILTTLGMSDDEKEVIVQALRKSTNNIRRCVGSVKRVR